MGGGGGGARSIGDVQSLIDRAKNELRKRNVFISFAYEDLDSVNLLRAHAKNENSPLEFNDWSVSVEIDSDRAPYIKQKITERIAQSSVTVVFISDKTQSSKWVRWEIEQSIALGKHVLGVYAGDVEPTVKPAAIAERGITCVRWADLAKTIEKLD